VLRTDDPAAAACYPGGGGYFLIRYRDRDQGAPRTVTVLGTGAPFTNAELADNGDAALHVNIFNLHTIGENASVPCVGRFSGHSPHGEQL